MNVFNSKKIYIAIAAAAISMNAWPYNITGRITSNDSAVKNVCVNITDSKGNCLTHALTDSKGIFSIQGIDSGRILLEAHGEGYSQTFIEVVVDNNDIDLGVLNIEKTVDLEEVTVTSKRVVGAPGKTMVFTSQLERDRAASPFNMLTILSYKVPEIQVNESERTISIEGEVPEFLINGIKRPISYLSTISPKTIQKIEFSTIPDVRFGKCYINITTLPVKEGGWLMTDLTGAVTTPRYFFKGVAEYSRGKNDFMIYYDGGFRDGKKEYTDELEQYIGGDKDISLEVKGMPSSTIDRYHCVNLYFTRIPSEKSMIAAALSLNIHNNDKKTHSHVTDFNDAYDRYNNRGFKQLAPTLNLYYNINLSQTARIEINAVGSYLDYSSHRHLTYTTGYNSDLTTKSHTWFFSTEALWRQNLHFALLNTGVSISRSDASNRYAIDGDISWNSLVNTRMNVYTSMSGNFLSVGYNLGLGVAYYKVDRRMVSPDITASFYKNVGNNLSLSYNFRHNPEMPNVASYNETVTPINQLLYHIGSEKLKIQRNFTNKIKLTFRRDKFNISVQGSLIRKTNPLLTICRYQNDPDKPLYGFFIESTGNGRCFTGYGFDFNAGVSNMWNFLSLSVSTGWGHNRLKTDERFSTYGWYLDFNTALYWKGWQLNFSADNLVTYRSMWGTNTIKRSWPYTSMAIYKNLGNWNLHVSWNNLFSRYGGRYRTETLSSVNTRSFDYRMNDQGNMVEIGVRYEFSSGKLLNKNGRSINSAERGDNGIIWDY